LMWTRLRTSSLLSPIVPLPTMLVGWRQLEARAAPPRNMPDDVALAARGPSQVGPHSRLSPVFDSEYCTYYCIHRFVFLPLDSRSPLPVTSDLTGSPSPPSHLRSLHCL
jgi:hypothetical protein